MVVMVTSSLNPTFTCGVVTLEGSKRTLLPGKKLRAFPPPTCQTQDIHT